MQIGLYKTDGTTAIAAYRTCTGTSYTFSFTDAELDAIYKLYGNNNSIQARVYLKTANTYYDYKTITITLKGNQKTMREKVNGTWKRGKVFIKVNGTWKNGVVWEKVNGTWKRGI
jgi:gamma-glutamylcysteine synthetase